MFVRCHKSVERTITTTIIKQTLQSSLPYQNPVIKGHLQVHVSNMVEVLFSFKFYFEKLMEFFFFEDH